jgi:hypothetical protein
MPGKLSQSVLRDLGLNSVDSELGDGALRILHLLSHLYVQRSFALWKDPVLTGWFADTVKRIHSSIPSDSKPHPLRQRFLTFYSALKPRYSIWRHLVVMESGYRSLFSFIPKAVLDKKSLACDPLPPVTMVNVYDEEFFKGTEDLFAIRTGRGSRMADQRLLERLLPDPVFRGQLQVMFTSPYFIQLVFSCRS